MNDGPNRNHAKAWAVLVLLVVEAGKRLGAGLSGSIVERILAHGPRRAACARGGGEPEDGDPGKTGAERDGRPLRDRKKTARDRQDCVADNSAEAGGQGPAPRRRKQGSQRRRRDYAGQIEADFQARPVKPPPGQEAPAPEGGRRQQRGGSEADELHDNIRGDRAWRAEKVMDARAGRVIETRIAHRPGQQRHGQAGHAGERHEASHFGRSPLRKFPHRGGRMIEK
jgi:hypothetical protein